MQAINYYVVIEKIKEASKKVGGLELTEDQNKDVRYLKGKVISVGDLVAAIKPNDISNMKSISLIMISLITPKKLGPIITPTIINPVTSGKPNFLRYELR